STVSNNPLAFRICRPVPQIMILPLSVTSTFFFILNVRKIRPTSWAQAGRSIPCYGTTHADYFFGDIPCARSLTADEINGEYEKNTGIVIAETFEGKNPIYVPGVLCTNHGPFSWGADAAEAVHNAVVMEEVAKMAYRCEHLKKDIGEAPQVLQDKHFFRKHGENAYYGNDL
ncbi:MAG: class II aldolase/adducin family protein, partial [Anaerostipes hadrus]|nr:class II aldolase/adducin family protein [Anaerostipes hadrus]